MMEKDIKVRQSMIIFKTLMHFGFLSRLWALYISLPVSNVTLGSYLLSSLCLSLVSFTFPSFKFQSRDAIIFTIFADISVFLLVSIFYIFYPLNVRKHFRDFPT